MSERPMADLLVYDALLEFGIGGGDYTANIADLATVAGISQAQTTRSLQSLVEAGALEFTGRRRGRTAIWRRGKNPPSQSAEARTDDRGYPPTGGYPGLSEEYVAADRTPLGAVPIASDSGQDEARRIDDEDEALVANSRINAYAILDTLDRGDDLGPPDLDQGDCGECGKTANVRWTLGLFHLCLECRRRRARAKTSGGRIAAKDPAAREADRTPPEDPLYDDNARELVHDLLAQTQTNGNRPDDPFDLLEEAPY